MYVIQNKFSKLYLLELGEEGAVLETQHVAHALGFDSAEAADAALVWAGKNREYFRIVLTAA